MVEEYVPGMPCDPKTEGLAAAIALDSVDVAVLREHRVRQLAEREAWNEEAALARAAGKDRADGDGPAAGVLPAFTAAGCPEELRPACLPVDPVSRTTYQPGDPAQCDLWFPPVDIPLGHGQSGRLPSSGRSLGCAGHPPTPTSAPHFR
ncbi:hypothetical protein [Streptomyces sp. GC420]|uniref:hypothetical protein n=1 Tax=Streptomyces sp. GC420 TaxID=2697568 RepID=UPI001FB5C0BF|nr:hypothetical protein [Streptomyces sp. GC420]